MKKRTTAKFRLIIALTGIFVFSLCASLLLTQGGKIQVDNITIDARGAVLTGELYTPAGISDKDSVPAVVLNHGGAVAYGVMRGMAGELAARGFVVFNVNSYGAGTAEQPKYDDGGQGQDVAPSNESPAGLLDAVNFVRTLKYVDQTRIATAGHSRGSRHAASTAIMDCGYYTFNDLMINILCDKFGQSFTEEEILMDAADLAAERLNADQLAHYKDLEASTREYYDTRIKSVCLVGSDALQINPLVEVTVGGHTVMRNCQTNFGIVTGDYDANYYDFPTRETTMEAWLTNGEPIQPDQWYSVDGAAGTSTILGSVTETSILNSEDLADAIYNRTVRTCTYNPETHSKNYFSSYANTDVVRYLVQTLGYNNGNLGDPSATPVDPEINTFLLRELMNGLAMFSMIGMILAAGAMILENRTFAPIVVGESKWLVGRSYNKITDWATIAVTIVFGMFAIHWVNINRNFSFANGMIPTIIRQGINPPLIWSYVCILAIGAVVCILINVFLGKAKEEKASAARIKELLGIGVKPTLKAVLLGLLLIAIAYGSVMVTEYLFNQDYRFWLMQFTEMRPEYWPDLLKFAVCILPLYLIIGVAINYAPRQNISQAKDTAITVFVHSVGIWIILAVHLIITFTSWDGTLFSSFDATYGLLIFLPATVYIARKMYNVTHNVWIGSIINSLLVAWSLVSPGAFFNMYCAQTWLSNIL